MEADVVADLERGGRKVSSADRLLVQRYVELIRSRSHSDTNTALKIWQTLGDKYNSKDSVPAGSDLDAYLVHKGAATP
jgi:hypothetical protein